MKKLGYWGPKLYQNDIAEDVRDYYKDQLHRGKTEAEIMQALIAKNEDALSDQDDGPVFWFALADTQWNLGRLEDQVKKQALDYINKGDDLKHWQAEDLNGAIIRSKVLLELKQKLLSPQPSKKKISQYKLYRCEWKIGDVYAYQLTGNYAKEVGLLNRYLYFIKVGEEVWHPGHVVPVVYFYWIIDEKLRNIAQLRNVKYIPQFFTPEAYKKNPKMNTQYLLTLLSTSSRVIPRNNLVFIGNINEVQHVENENQNSYKVAWKDFEKYIIGNFQSWGNE